MSSGAWRTCRLVSGPRVWSVAGVCICACDVTGLDGNANPWSGVVSAIGADQGVLSSLQAGAAIRVSLCQHRTTSSYDGSPALLIVTDRIRVLEHPTEGDRHER